MKFAEGNSTFAGSFFNNMYRSRVIVILFILLAFRSHCQTVMEADKFIAGLTRNESTPSDLLSGRCAVLFPDYFNLDELTKIQKAFQQTGIDAVEYYRSAVIFAGKDMMISYAPMFSKRSIRFLIFLQKENDQYQFFFLPYSPKNVWTKPAQAAWFVHSSRLQDALMNIFRTLSSTQKRQNFLINDFPEQEPVTDLFVNTRNESMIQNLKSFKLAIPGMGNQNADEELRAWFKEKYHGKYDIVSDTMREKEMGDKGFRYVLRYIHAPDKLARELLGYDLTKSESAITSVTYPNGALQLKAIPAEAVVYKFYIKDLEDKNLYLGLKWDADILWLDALKNYIDGYRVTGRIN